MRLSSQYCTWMQNYLVSPALLRRLHTCCQVEVAHGGDDGGGEEVPVHARGRRHRPLRVQ